MTTVGIIGGGPSGLGWAHALNRLGFRTTILERQERPGGQWVRCYPGVTLQNTYREYLIPEFPWPFQPEEHPTGEEVLRYFAAAVKALGLDVRYQHEVVRTEYVDDHWVVDCSNGNTFQFDKLVVGTGYFDFNFKFSSLARLPGCEGFRGEVVVNERNIQSLDEKFKPGKKVVVVGMGKSALDMTVFAAKRGCIVHHVFREPRYQLPVKVLGIHSFNILFSRLNGTILMPSWDYPTKIESLLQKTCLPGPFWKALAYLFLYLIRQGAAGPEALARLEKSLPKQGTNLTYEFRSAIPLTTNGYYPLVAQGEIRAQRGEVRGFAGGGGVEVTQDGQVTVIDDVDMVIFAVGHAPPTFPFLPERFQNLIGQENDGAQLFRHILLPEGPAHLALAMNHGFLHIPTSFISGMWMGALWRGDFGPNPLPSPSEMKQNAAKILEWKRKYILFEPTRLYGSNTRFQQTLDMFCQELGISPYRKIYRYKQWIFAALILLALLVLLGQLRPLTGLFFMVGVPVFIEGFLPYSALDYGGVMDEFLSKRKSGQRLVIDGQKMI